MKKHIVFLTFLFLAACSSDKDSGAAAIPGADLPPLTVEQQGRLAVLSQEVTDVSAALSAQQSKSTGQTDDQGSSVSSKSQLYKKAVEAGVDSGACKVSQTGAPKVDNEEMLQNINFKLEISDADGAVCPYYSFTRVDMSSQSKETGSSMDSSMSVDTESKFNAKETSDLYKDIDVYSMDQNFKATVKAGGNQSAIKVEMNGSGSSTLLSKTEQKVVNTSTLTVSGSGNETKYSMSVQLVTDYVLKDFRVVGVMKIFMDNNSEEPVMTYYINGKSVTAEEFAKYLSPALLENILASTPMG